MPKRYLTLKMQIKKKKKNKLMSFCINYEKLLGKYQTIWTKIEDLKTIEFNAFQSMMIDT